MKIDVLVVGAGLAGMCAALSACKEGASVMLADRGPLGTGTNSVLANGVFGSPTARFSREAYVNATFESGRLLNRRHSVELAAREAAMVGTVLRSAGLDIHETPVSHIVVSPRPEVIPGITLMRKLSEEVRACSSIKIITGLCITDIVTEVGRVAGFRGISKSGQEVFISSKTIVLATGGAGAIYLKNDNQKNILGQGYLLAARAGLQLLDMEFVQFYPFVIDVPGLPQVMIYPPYPAEAKVINSAGEDLMLKYGWGDLTQGILKKRDELATRLYEETLIAPVYMDYRGVPEQAWKKHPVSLLTRIKYDFRTRPVCVSPAAHFFMGGVETDDNMQTKLEGLFACGEIIWGLHGANRMGGNALTECVISGCIAGREAARQPRQIMTTGRKGTEAGEKQFSFGPTAIPEFRDILRELRAAAWETAGVVRSEQGMQKGLEKMGELKARFSRTRARNQSEALLENDCRSALFTLEAVLIAGIGRKESRGSFVNSDYPREENPGWLKNSCLTYDPQKDSLSVHYRPVE